ncbi:MAG: DUF5667 domain-containing protein [Actinomycetota bacterium]|nr:DUF5667 domain-containing protein [Actinomycetota bacterium]
MDMTVGSFELKRMFEEALLKLNEGETFDDIIASHRALAGDLKVLLRADELLRAHLFEEEPSPVFADEFEKKLISSIYQAPVGGRAKNSFLYYRAFSLSARVAVASVLCFALLGGGAALSESALPTSPLYALKKGAESARLVFAVSNESKARLHVKFAQKRLDELKNLREEEAAGGAKEALMAEFDKNIRLAEDLAAPEISKDKAGLLIRAGELIGGAELALKGGGLNQSPAHDASPDPLNPSLGGEAGEPGQPALESSTLAATYQRASLAPLTISDLAADNLNFSPNGDSVKDEVKITLKARSGQRLSGAIFRGDIVISSNLRFKENESGGSYWARWDGRDDGGSALDNGVYTIKVFDGLGRYSSTDIRVILDTAPPSFSLQAPLDGQVFEGGGPTFAWQLVGDAASYTLQISTAPDFRSGSTLTFKDLADNVFTLASSKLKGGRYFVRALATDLAGNVSSTTASTFTLLAGGEEDKK